jgi:hypothetical protein
MAGFSRTLNGNRLIRRLNRHRSISRLFRSAVSGRAAFEPAGGQHLKARSVSQAPVVTASLPGSPADITLTQPSMSDYGDTPHESQSTQLSSLAAQSGMIEQPRTLTNGISLRDEQRTTEIRPVSEKLPPQRVRTIAGPSQDSGIKELIQKAESKSLSTNAPDSYSNEAESYDATWRRLQTILRKHEGEQNPKQLEPSSVELPIVEERSSASAHQEVQRQPIRSSDIGPHRLTAEDSSNDREINPTEVVARTAPDRPIDEDGISRLSSIPAKPHYEKTEESSSVQPVISDKGQAEGENVPNRAPIPENPPDALAQPIERLEYTVIQDKTSEVEPRQEVHPSDVTVVSKPRLEQSVETLPGNVRNPEFPIRKPATEQTIPDLDEALKSHTIAVEGEPASEVETDDNLVEKELPESHPQSENPLPLEAVWLVQRTSDPGEYTAPPGHTDELSNTSTPDESETAGRIDQERISQTLERVTPGQSTGSAVELILPRHTRPIPSQLETTVHAAPSVQPLSIPDTGAIQRQEDAHQPPESRWDSETLVPTEIGPLPADLWHLLGEKPPSVTESSGQARSNQESDISTLERNRTGRQQYEKTTPSNDRKPRESSLEIQRQPAQAGDGSDLLSRPTPTTPGSTGAGGERGAEKPAELDLDELARQVYQEIRRLLAVERERRRRK